MTAYAELATTSNFSFLRGASHPADLVITALRLGHTGLGLADRNSVAGVVRAWSALKTLREDGLPPPERQRSSGEPGAALFLDHPDTDALRAESDAIKARAGLFRLFTGARLVFADGTPDILAYPADRDGWARLCQLLTTGMMRADKGDCLLDLEDLLADTRGLLLILMPGRALDSLHDTLARLTVLARPNLWLAASMLRRGDDRRRLARLLGMANGVGVPLLAVNDVLYATAEARARQDILTCIRTGVTIADAGRRLQENAERHLKPAAEMARLFRDCPDAIAQTQHVLDRSTFDLGQLRYDYPDEPVPDGWSAQAWLAELVRRRAPWRYPAGVPQKVQGLLDAELKLIEKLDYARYFLTIHDIVRFAEERAILCQGRGSAANSAVCYVLGITAVDPAEHDLLFARFISEERREPPDIDVDFEHERREEVIQHIYERYGRHRAGIAATVVRYRPRSAMREVGKAFGLSDDVTARLSSTVWGSYAREIDDARIAEAGLDPANPLLHRALDLARQLLGYPRHLSQHVGGFILARVRLDAMVPIGNAAMPDRSFIEWDKDDIDALGLMKIDILALGMLSCIRRAFDLLRSTGGPDLDLATVPKEDPAVYDMLCRGDSIGVFQVESRAQINMLPRMRPRCFQDLVIEVAIVRPGPIQGDMVHPYLRRRNGLEKVVFPAPDPAHGPPDELHRVLHRTLGVPLFQEQAMRLAMVAARFTDVEANQLRRAMATFRHVGTIHRFEALMVERMVARGYARDFAENCFRQIEGFGSYGFPESHAASFAKLVYVSSWLKCHHPAVFACALLNSQPMGFYAPAQIVRDASEHGVLVRPVDVNASDWDNRLESGADGALALRLGFRQITGLAETEVEALIAARGTGYPDLQALGRVGGVSARTRSQLADADACGSLGLPRRRALWEMRRLPDAAPLPLFAAAAAAELGREARTALPDMPRGEEIATDYQTLRLSLKGHPMAILRPLMEADGVLPTAALAGLPSDRWARIAGIVLVRQRPGNGKAIFITLEDESGVANIVLWASRMARFRRVVMAARLMQVDGRVQKSPEGIIHLMAVRILDRSADLSRLANAGRICPAARPITRATCGSYPRSCHAPGSFIECRPGLRPCFTALQSMSRCRDSPEGYRDLCTAASCQEEECT